MLLDLELRYLQKNSANLLLHSAQSRTLCPQKSGIFLYYILNCYGNTQPSKSVNLIIHVNIHVVRLYLPLYDCIRVQDSQALLYHLDQL